MTTPQQELWLKNAPGRRMNPDGAYGLQCVDLSDDYCIALFGNWASTLGAGNAATLFNAANPAYFQKIANDPNDLTLIPERGDIIIWGPMPGNPAGHIAVVLSATQKNVTVVEQDGFLQIPARVSTHPYNLSGGITVGWLRPRYTKIVTAQGGAEDMTNEQIVTQALIATQRIDPATYPKEALAGHVARLAAGTPLATIIGDFIHDAGLLDAEGYNLEALATYAQAKDMPDPERYAYDRWMGGATFETVLTSDLHADRDAAVAQAETNRKLVEMVDAKTAETARLQSQLAAAKKPDPLPDTRTWQQLVTDGLNKMVKEITGK